eukprot:10439814-Alexandrium_andersonii.AAC.1
MVRCTAARSTPLTWRTSKPGARQAQLYCSRSPTGPSCFSAQPRSAEMSGYLPKRTASAFFFESLHP